jgi:hypothetical protein
MSETPSEEQGVPAVEAPEAQRNLAAIVAGDINAVVTGVVTGVATGVATARVLGSRISDKGKDGEAPAPDADPPS